VIILVVRELQSMPKVSKNRFLRKAVLKNARQSRMAISPRICGGKRGRYRWPDEFEIDGSWGR
jgi:hypothetical protein